MLCFVSPKNPVFLCVWIYRLQTLHRSKHAAHNRRQRNKLHQFFIHSTSIEAIEMHHILWKIQNVGKKVVVYQAPRPQVLSPSSPEYLWNRNRWRKEKGKKRKKIINDIKVSTFLCSFSVTLYFIAILPFFAVHQKCVNEPQLI